MRVGSLFRRTEKSKHHLSGKASRMNIKTLKMYQVDAFADRIFRGNPAAVLILDEWLPDEVMQALAAENNLAETAFSRPNPGGRDLRWFTPTQEVDFCGHATLATAHILASEYGASDEMVFSTRVGELRVTQVENSYRLDLPCFTPEPVINIRIPESMFTGKALAVFRNFENIYIELANERAIRDFVPDFVRIGELAPLGLVITARGDEYDFVSRCFFPSAGIPEDPVTGSAHSTLVPYWAEKLGKNRLSAFQCSRRGGHLDCELADDRVMIQGSAVTFMRAVISVDWGLVPIADSAKNAHGC